MTYDPLTTNQSSELAPLNVTLEQIGPNPVVNPQDLYCQEIIKNVGITLGIENPEIRYTTPSNELSPSERARADFHKAHLKNYFEDSDMSGSKHDISVLEGLNVIVPPIEVGWGHKIQGHRIARDYALMGMNVFEFDPMDVMKAKDKEPYEIISGFLKTVQKNQDVKGYIAGIGRDSERLTDKAYYALARTLMGVASSVAGFDESDDSWLTRNSKALVEKVSGNHAIVSQALQFFVNAEIALSEVPFSRVIKEVVPIIKPVLVTTTHPAVVRGLDHDVDVSVLAAIPDPGYRKQEPKLDSQYHPDNIPLEERSPVNIVDDENMLVPFVPSPVKGRKGKRSNSIYTVPTEEMENSINKFFRPDSEIVEVGTITDSITTSEFVDKWRSPKRNILLSTMGNAHNISEITRMASEFVLAGPERTSGYELSIFLGEHKDEVIGDELLSILDQHPEINLIRTQSKHDTPEMKIECEKAAHLEFRTGGENALSAGNTGCVPVCTFSSIANEQNNTIYSWRAGSAIPSSYPSEEYGSWLEYVAKIDPSESDELATLQPTFDNFVNYLDYLFGESRLAEKAAIDGFVNLNSQSNLHILMLSTQMILNKLEGKGGITKQEIQSINDYMSRVKEEVKLQKKVDLKKAGFIN